MRVAIVTPLLSHFEVPLLRLASSLPGLDVRVLHTDPSEEVCFDTDYRTIIDWGERRRAGYENTYYQSVTELADELFAWRPRTILQYGYAWKGALRLLAQARFRSLPVVHRGLLTPFRNTRQNRVLGAAWRTVQPAFLRRFQGHHYGGTYSEAVLKAAHIPENRRYFVPFSVDTPYFAARADDPCEEAKAMMLRRDLGWSADALVVLFMCQHSWFKAPDVMVRAAREAQRVLPDLKLIMAGSGAMTDELAAFAAQNLAAGSFHFPGYVSSKQTMPYYLASDLVMFPSRYDTWSRGVNEAMLARRPCIVSRVVPAAGGLVDDEVNGYVVDGLDPMAFAGRIAKFVAMPTERRRAMGESARARALQFSYEAHVDELRRSLTDVAASGG